MERLQLTMLEVINQKLMCVICLIIGVYTAKMHPDVRSGKKTEDEVLGEFLDTFEVHHATHVIY